MAIMPISMLEKETTMHLKTLLFAGGIFMIPTFSLADTVVLACTSVQIIEPDGVKTLNTVPTVKLFTSTGEVSTGNYKSKKVTMTLQGNDNIICALHIPSDSK